MEPARSKGFWAGYFSRGQSPHRAACRSVAQLHTRTVLVILSRMNEKTEGVAEEKVKNGGDNFLAASILVAALIIGGSVIYSTRAKLPAPVKVDDTQKAPSAGLAKALEITARDVIAENEKAPVTIIEYGDYQCPFCEKFFSGTESLLRENYLKTGKAKMIYRNLAFLGPESTAAAEAAECAKDQGKFWAYHDEIYLAEGKDGRENNGNLDKDLLVTLARNAGMDEGKFTECFDQKKYEKEVQNEATVAPRAGIGSTPSFMVVGGPSLDALSKIDALAGAVARDTLSSCGSSCVIVSGALPYDMFKAILDAGR